MIDNIQQDQLDYSELANVRGLSLNMGWFSSWQFVAIALPLGVVVLLSTIQKASIWLTVILLLSVGAVYLIAASRRQKKRNKIALVAFAAHNGFQYVEKLSIDTGVGSLFEHGHSKSMQNVISGTLSELEFKLFKYIYTTGSGKNSQSHDAMVMEIELPRVLPQFVIDSVIESGVSTLPINFDKSQKIELEGDFHKYFDLYAPDTYGVSALTILAPDTMEVLMQHAALCDVEIIQNKLYFYWPIPAKNQADYMAMFKTAETVLIKMKPKLMQDNIFATHGQERVHSQVAANGARLKRSSAWVFTIVFLAVYLSVEVFGAITNANIEILLFPIILISAIGWAIYTGMKQSSLKKEYLSRYQSK